MDLMLVLLAIGALGALLTLAIPRIREYSRRSACFENLRMFGIAFETYCDVESSFPPGGTTRDDDPTKTWESIHGIFLPYFEETSLDSLFVSNKDWRQQLTWVAATAIPLYRCPASTADNPVVDRLRNELLLASGVTFPVDQRYGTTSYVLCRGVTDAWCRCWDGGARSVPRSERGLFDMNWSMKASDIKDGLAHTIAIGDGADSAAWVLADRTSRDRAVGPDKYGTARSAYQAWLAMEPATSQTPELHVSSVFACTLAPINKKPVTESWADVEALDDCRKSGRSATGTIGLTTSGGPHSTPNFRSDHPGGCNFLFADRSVHFLDENIDMLVYQRLSTPMGGEAAEVPSD